MAVGPGISHSDAHMETEAALVPHQNGPSGANIAQDPQYKLSSQGILTHGYVHGHIHKHGDHTHIHGHIHNHDHHSHNADEGSFGAVSEVQRDVSEVNIDSCHELDDYELCKDMFCDELDDCYFSTCDDSRVDCEDDAYPEADCKDHFCEEEGLVHSCDDPQCLEPLKEVSSSTVCTDEDCFRHEGDYDYQRHDNNLCDLQMVKKPIFENLIENLHKGLGEPIQKRRKMDANHSDLQIHFPHKCHPQPELLQQEPHPESFTPSSHHHVHQSCFHAKIPNTETAAETAMSDFDFYVHFNNFNQLLEDSTTKQIFGENGPSKKDLFENLPLFQDKDPKLLNQASHRYACQWDKCATKLTDGTFMEHLLQDHIETEYDTKTAPASQSFQCEWNECNYMNDDLSSLIGHLNTHKGIHEHDFSSIVEAHLPALTPTSIAKSQDATPKENNVNITAMKFSHKCKKGCSHPIDAQFTCQWQVGTENGKPVACSRTHESTGDLQRHLIEDHIHLGKSVYHCHWIGCERNNGKCFTQRQKLLRHIHIHTNHKPCECPICGACFAVDSMLKQHMRVHSGEKPFSCNICGKRFATSSSLSIHNRVHTGERPLECKWPGCGKRFSESSNLTKHMKIHMKTYKCETCHMEFDKKPDYTKHMKLHARISLPVPENMSENVPVAF